MALKRSILVVKAFESAHPSDFPVGTLANSDTSREGLGPEWLTPEGQDLLTLALSNLTLARLMGDMGYIRLQKSTSVLFEVDQRAIF